MVYILGMFLYVCASKGAELIENDKYLGKVEHCEKGRDD
jgi:hypothetical protein